jgi:CRISPR/Cas system-associated exonuclease Cas4 (RecB family)
MELLTSSISRHNRYPHNHQRNVYHIKYNLVRQIASVNSRINEYLENKTTYINIQEIN